MRKAILLISLLLCLDAAAQRFSVGTNTVDWLSLGTMNMEASAAVSRSVSFHLGAGLNPWSYRTGDPSTQFQMRQGTVRAGARWWPWHIYSGWWLTGKLKWQEYNYGGFTSPHASEGDRYGGSLSAGYTFMLNTHLNLDIGLGLWGGYDKYTAYECLHCGRISGSGEKVFILPNDILLTISYIF